MIRAGAEVGAVFLSVFVGEGQSISVADNKCLDSIFSIFDLDTRNHHAIFCQRCFRLNTTVRTIFLLHFLFYTIDITLSFECHFIP